MATHTDPPLISTDLEHSPLNSPARNSDLARSASFTYLPAAKELSFNSTVVTIDGDIAHDDIVLPLADETSDISPPESSGWTTPDEHACVDESHSAAAMSECMEGLGVDPAVSETRDFEVQDGLFRMSEPTAVAAVVRPARTSSLESSQSLPPSVRQVTSRARPSINTSFSRRFNRASWHDSSPSTTSQSRSPSPKQRERSTSPSTYEVGNENARSSREGRFTRTPFLRRRDGRSSKTRSKDGTPFTPTTSEIDDAPPFESTSSTHRSRLITGAFRSSSRDDRRRLPTSTDPSLPHLHKSFSTDKFAVSKPSADPDDRAVPLPRIFPTGSLTRNALVTPKKKDELWSAFRTLDAEFTKFSSKSSAFKANVVRTSLLPFLRAHASHPSNPTLRPEDLDRRVNILNKWWNGLIEMLHGRNNQSISGTDRPAILDGIVGIMERPEWRSSPSPYCPVQQRVPLPTAHNNRSATSLSSSGTSDFLTESVHHNTRNIFVHNLSAQMAFVVDKMSLRLASASLVTFCGKACAYAFLFVPGMADVLVRLWDLPMSTIRRVLNENGIGKFDDLSRVAADIVTAFPPALHRLGFTSLSSYLRQMKTPPPLPLGTSKIQWWGHWLQRWTGRESDLFYVFAKYYHILVVDFLPETTSKHERMCAPGLVLVHAQLLANLDATIHRGTGHCPQESASPAGVSTSSDNDALDPDAVAAPLPIPPATSNAVRVMAENRSIMLVRDVLSENHTTQYTVARRLFAESFNDLLQACARHTSVFDHAACYTLLEFLEEALTILVRYEQLQETEQNLINSDFWQSVCKSMLLSRNTTTEIRLYAFLYTVWNTVVCDLGRKSNLCLNFLLDPEIFESRFNHWCPMVRAYYMRLLCWRVGRYDGTANDGDLLILETLLLRLRSVWAHYLYLRDTAGREQKLPPATNPCNPAPSRRLVIVRKDMQANPASAFISFDGIVPAAVSGQKRLAMLTNGDDPEARPASSRSTSDSESVEPGETGIGGFFRKVMGTGKSRNKSQKPSSRTRQPLNAPAIQSGGRNPDMASRSEEQKMFFDEVGAKLLASHAMDKNYCFKFSLEHHPTIKHAASQMRLHAPRLPMPAQQYLQAHAINVEVASDVLPIEPVGESKDLARYCGRALAEWTVVVGECQSFFDRRRLDGVTENRLVETPTLGVEAFRRPS